MVVITLTDCPPKLRGDLTKWLIEINTGVFVGKINARVREEVWQRVCDNLSNGRATMVFSANNEQRYDFAVCHSQWEPVDYDGVKLIRRPLPGAAAQVNALKPGFSHAAQRQIARRTAAGSRRNRTAQDGTRYVVIDIETTGLHAETDEIIEIAALRVENGTPTASFSKCIAAEKPLSKEIQKLTSLTPALLQAEGVSLQEAIPAFLDFLGKDQIVCHHAAFDYRFLSRACRQCGLRMAANPCADTLILSRKQIRQVADYQLTTLAKYFGWQNMNPHRALNDCEITSKLYEQLKGGGRISNEMQ